MERPPWGGTEAPASHTSSLGSRASPQAGQMAVAPAEASTAACEGPGARALHRTPPGSCPSDAGELTSVSFAKVPRVG